MTRRWNVLPLATAAAASLLAGCDYGCANRVISEWPSPDGSRHAVVFERDCGATTGFSTQVSVVAPGRVPAGGGNIFIADGDHGAVPPGPGGGPPVHVQWLGPRMLEVRYPPRARLFAPEARPRELEVRLVADSTVGSAT